jgi:hypothetical protein
MIMTSDKVCGRWIDKKRNNSGERQKKKKLGFITVKREEGLFFALKREIKWAELRLILEGWRGNGKQEVKKGEEKKRTWVMKFEIGQLRVHYILMVALIEHVYFYKSCMKDMHDNVLVYRALWLLI